MPRHGFDRQGPSSVVWCCKVVRAHARRDARGDTAARDTAEQHERKRKTGGKKARNWAAPLPLGTLTCCAKHRCLEKQHPIDWLFFPPCTMRFWLAPSCLNYWISAVHASCFASDRLHKCTESRLKDTENSSNGGPRLRRIVPDPRLFPMCCPRGGDGGSPPCSGSQFIETMPRIVESDGGTVQG